MTDTERDAIREFIHRTVTSAVTKAVGEIDLGALRGKDGRDGIDGKDAVLDIGTLAKEVVALVPLPKDGEAGKDGRGIEAATVGEGMLVLRFTDGTEEIVGRVMGEPGASGKDAVLDLDALALEVAALVPLPKDGKDGKDADPVDRVTLAKDVLALIPVPRDGKDGIASMDDLRAEVAKAVEATVGPTVEKQVTEAIDALPTLQYRGVFREGTTYKAGECVTRAGAMWHADADTEDKPGSGETAWTLMVKRGDKGKDAVLDIDALAKQVAAIVPKVPK